jgi:hypothetical protein
LAALLVLFNQARKGQCRAVRPEFVLSKPAVVRTPTKRLENSERLAPMKVKIFDVVLHDVPPGRSPATQLEDQINGFLKHNPNLQAVATHMNTLVLPPAGSSQDLEPKQPTVIIFATLFYHT